MPIFAPYSDKRLYDMHMKIWTILLALSLFAAACSEAPEQTAQAGTKTIRVTVGSGPRVGIEPQSRTEIGDDGVTVTWAEKDNIALWAATADGETAFSAATLSLWHYNAAFDNARFTGDVPVMEEGSYTYYAVSPAPAAVNGTHAAYDIPAVQDGGFNGACDVMVAAPVNGPALAEGDNSDVVRLAFRHKIHVLKIRIAGNKLGEPISRLTLAFPQPVTGRLTVDAADPDAAPTLTEGSNLLTIDLKEAIDKDAVVYAIIAPVQIDPSEKITVTAFSQKRESKPGTFAGKDFTAGHTTPIALTVPEAAPVEVRIELTNTGEETLGETVTSFTLAVDGAQFDNGESTRTFAVTGTGEYSMTFAEYPEALQGKTVTVTYESENALVSQTLTLPETFDFSKPIASLRVPYLLEERFDNLTDDFSIHDNQELGANLSGGADLNYNGTTDLQDYGLPEGWTAGRVGGKAKTAIRICGRNEAQGKYPGRLDSAPLKGIKEGHTVKISVSFNYSGDKNEYKGSFLAAPYGDTIFAYGYTTESGAFNGNTALHHIIREGIVLPAGGSFDKMLSEAETFTLENCDNTYRLSWQANTNRSWSWSQINQNGNYWLYLDNIEVSILPANE